MSDGENTIYIDHGDNMPPETQVDEAEINIQEPEAQAPAAETQESITETQESEEQAEELETDTQEPDVETRELGTEAEEPIDTGSENSKTEETDNLAQIFNQTSYPLPTQKTGDLTPLNPDNE